MRPGHMDFTKHLCVLCYVISSLATYLTTLKLTGYSTHSLKAVIYTFLASKLL